MPTAVDTAIAIVSLAEAKEYLKVTSSNDDAIISHLINAVSGWLKGYCKRDFVRKDYVEYYSGDGSRDLILKNRPVNSITSLYIDSLRAWSSDTAIDVTANLIVKKGQGILRSFNLLYGFTYGDSNIKVSYNAGYTAATDGGATGTMPYDVRMAAKRLIDVQYRLGYSQRKLDNSSESQSGVNITYKDFDLPKDVKDMLDGWARVLPSPQFEYAD